MLPIQNHIVFYQFSRDLVETGDFTRFLKIYDLPHLPLGPALRRMMGTLVFSINGYDDDPREVFQIPEVRNFYQAFHKAWPYSAYFVNLETETFLNLALCCLPDVLSGPAYDRGEEGMGIPLQVNPTQLIDFVKDSFPPLNFMCDRAKLHKPLLEARTLALFRSVHLKV